MPAIFASPRKAVGAPARSLARLVLNLELDLAALRQAAKLGREVREESSPLVGRDRGQAHAVGRLFRAERREHVQKLARLEPAAVLLKLQQGVQGQELDGIFCDRLEEPAQADV